MKEQLYTFREMIAAMYRDTEADKVAYIPWMNGHRDERVPRPYFEECIQISFEDMALPVPKERETVCRILYGKDYMPPIIGMDIIAQGWMKRLDHCWIFCIHHWMDQHFCKLSGMQKNIW